jgi:hypothetical protein
MMLPISSMSSEDRVKVVFRSGMKMARERNWTGVAKLGRKAVIVKRGVDGPVTPRLQRG